MLSQKKITLARFACLCLMVAIEIPYFITVTADDLLCKSTQIIRKNGFRNSTSVLFSFNSFSHSFYFLRPGDSKYRELTSKIKITDFFHIFRGETVANCYRK